MKIEFRTKDGRYNSSHIECVVTTDCGRKVVFEEYVGSKSVGDILVEKLSSELLMRNPMIPTCLLTQDGEQPEGQESGKESEMEAVYEVTVSETTKSKDGTVNSEPILCDPLNVVAGCADEAVEVVRQNNLGRVDKGKLDDEEYEDTVVGVRLESVRKVCSIDLD